MVQDYDEPPEPLGTGGQGFLSRGPLFPRPSGTAVIQIVIDAKGRVASARVVRSLPFYDDMLIDAIKTWNFKPASKGGQPVAARMLVSTTFQGNTPPRTKIEEDNPGRESSPAPQDELGRPGAQPPEGVVPLVASLTYDRRGADFTAWEGRLKAEVQRAWRGPGAADLVSPCDTTFQVEVERDGTVSGVRISRPSGNAAFDRAGLRVLFGASLGPLPAQYPADRVSISVTLSGAPAPPFPG